MRGARLVAAAGLLATASVASADFLAIELSFEYTGAFPPAGSPPWLRAEFSSSAAGEVDVKLISLLAGDMEKITTWLFNLDPAMDPTALDISHVGGQAPDAVLTGTDAHRAAGDGFFDIFFDFPNSGDTFGKGETSEYKITSTDAITASSFGYLSVGGPGGKPGFMSAAHVQGIGPTGANSGWIASGGEPPVIPLPAPVALGGFGLALAAGVRTVARRR